MRYRNLTQIVGNGKAKRIFASTILIYFTLFVGLSYLFVGSFTDIAVSMFVGLDEAENLLIEVILAGVLSALLARGTIRWFAGEHKKLRLILDIFVLAIFVPFIGVAILFSLGFVSFIVTSPLSEQLTPSIGLNLATFISFTIPTLASITTTWNILPSEKADMMKNIHSDLDIVHQKLTVAKSDLNSYRYNKSLQQLRHAKEDFEDILDTKPPTEGTSERIAAARTRINKLSELIAEETISEVRNQISSGKYIEANKLLTKIEQTEIQYKSSAETIGSLREEVDKNLLEIVSSEMDGMKESLEMAKQAKRDGGFDDAHYHLNKVSEHKSNINEISKEYVHDTFHQLTSRIPDLRSEISQAEEEAHIQTHREQIAGLLNISESQVQLNSDEPEIYHELEQAIDELDQLKRDHPDHPWVTIEKDIIENFPASADKVQAYSDIISDSGEILRYIKTAGESHPSIHATEWREIIDTALSEMSSDVLKSVISDIEQLNQGLWEQDDLYQMSWQEFEHLIGSLYESLGYKTEVTQAASDMGVDVWAERDGVRRAIQVKQFGQGNTVGREPLQKTVSAIAKGDADEAVVVTSSQFTQTATEYAAEFGPELELIPGRRLIEKLSLSDVPPPTSESSKSNSVSNTTQEPTSDTSSDSIGTPLTDKRGDWNNKGKYAYDAFYEATGDIKELKRNREHDKAEELLLWCINFAESETKPGVRGHPRWYYKHLAIIYRKEHRHQDEVDILQRYISFCNKMNIEPRDEIINRLNKAKQLTIE